MHIPRLHCEFYPSLFVMKKQHDSSGTAMKGLHQIGFFLALFTSQSLAFSPPFKQQWQQCCSCEACGPGTSFHTLAVVDLEGLRRGVWEVGAALGNKLPLPRMQKYSFQRQCRPTIMTTREQFWRFSLDKQKTQLICFVYCLISCYTAIQPFYLKPSKLIAKNCTFLLFL